ncbi:MAG: NRDE family protein [Planctomycetota bacterium]|nr:NRDE family protein [Planctomycetota bacterium]
MCTVSVISLSGERGLHLAGAAGFRVMVNRDEQRDRPAALFPRWRSVAASDPSFARAGVRAIWPIDPRGGGTWVGASDRGLVLCLLNVNPTPPPSLPPNLVSRGAIIPRLIGAEGGAGVLRALATLDLERFAPFRLVVIEPDRPGRAWRGGHVVSEAWWDRDELRVRAGLVGQACFVSSGLGDGLVAGRLALFDQQVAGAPSPEAQERFHAHRWTGREHLSVLMSREDARTVSVTTVEVAPRAAATPGVRLAYRPVYAAQRDSVAVAPLA